MSKYGLCSSNDSEEDFDVLVAVEEVDR